MDKCRDEVDAFEYVADGVLHMLGFLLYLLLLMPCLLWCSSKGTYAWVVARVV